MGNIAAKFATAFRDYVIDGVPSSGAHDPVKSEIRDIGPAIESSLSAITLGNVSISYGTKAEIDADLDHDADSVGLVYNDATDANNDLYVKVGASGSGSWTQTTILHDVIEGIASPFVLDAEDAEAGANAARNDAESLVELGNLKFRSISMPRENGENYLGVNGGLELPNSDNLFKVATAQDTPFLNTEGAWAVIWRNPVEQYDGIRRSPTFCGTHRIGRNTNRMMALGYICGSDNGMPLADVGKYRAELEQETAGGEVDILSAMPPSDFSNTFIQALRFDGTNFALDLFDLADGTKTAGPSQAKPAGWAGMFDVKENIGVGITEPSNFPQNITAEQTISYARGDFGGMIMLDGSSTDAEWQRVAAGESPLDVWPLKVRAWVKGVDDDGKIDLNVYSNLATAVAYDDEILQRGKLFAGPSLRKQDEATYFYAKPLPYPALVNHQFGSDVGMLPIEINCSGLTDGSDIRMRIISDAGLVVQDWAKVGEVAATVSLNLKLPKGKRMLYLDFEEIGSGLRYVVGPISVGVGLSTNGQSQIDYLFQLGMSELGDNGNMIVDWDGDAGSHSFVGANGPVNTATFQKPALFTGAERRGILGNGIVEFFNEASKIWDCNVHLFCYAVSGTTVQDTVQNDGSPDVRDMADIYDILEMSAGRDENDLLVKTVHGQGWHSSGSLENYVDEKYKPLLNGIGSASIPQDDIDDYFYSSSRISPHFATVVFCPNRIIGTTPSGVTNDSRSEHLTRQNIRDNYSDLGAGVYLGAEWDVHKLTGDAFTHPDFNERNGSILAVRWWAHSLALPLGLGNYKGPVTLKEARFTDAGRTEIDLHFIGPIGTNIGPKEAGFDMTGIEVNDDKGGFSVSKINGYQLRLTKDSGAWSASDIVEIKPGGSGNYVGSAGHVEDDWIDGTLMSNGFLVTGTGADVTILEHDA